VLPASKGNEFDEGGSRKLKSNESGVDVFLVHRNVYTSFGDTENI
jgi:hypothetical protein